MTVKPLATGIYGIIGAPGAGKSFKAVREIVRSVCVDGRPVYTNVPIRPKKLRAYIYCKLPKKIKGHRRRRARANLVKPITQQHFRYFCFRLSLIDALAERVMDEMGGSHGDLGELADFQQTEARNEAIRRVSEATPDNIEDMIECLRPVEGADKAKYLKDLAHYEAVKHSAINIIGPPKITGRNANWIPPGCVLFLDELHKWFPSRAYKDEPKEILDFTSMHRHMQLKVFVMSQRWMNVSLSFRSMAKEVWYCMNYARQPILGFLRINQWCDVFRYVHYNGESIEERTGLPAIGAKPVWSEMVCPQLTGGVEFDLYKSYSHAGTLEQQQKEINAVTAAMLGEAVDDEPAQQKGGDDVPKKQHLGSKLNRWLTIAAVLVLAVMVGRWTAGGGGDDDELELADQASPQPEPVAELAEPADTSAPAPTIQVPPPWADYTIAGVHPKGVIIDGRNHQTGSTLHDLLLVSVDPEAGDSAWLARDGTTYRGRIGDRLRPGLLPDVIREQLAELVRSIEARRRAAAAPRPPANLDHP